MESPSPSTTSSFSSLFSPSATTDSDSSPLTDLSPSSSGAFSPSKEGKDTDECKTYLEEKFGSTFNIREATLQDLDYQNEVAALEEMVYWGHEDGKLRHTTELGIHVASTSWLSFLSKLKKGSLMAEVKANVSVEIIGKTTRIVDKLIDSKKYPNIERDLLFALSLYTSEAFYVIVNKALRREGPSQEVFDSLRKWSYCMYNFIRGYRCLPSAGRTTVYRGLSRKKETEEIETEGKVILFEAFTSCSLLEEVAVKFAAPKDNPLLLKIVTVSGRCLTPFSHYSKEEEILLRPFTSFRVTKCYNVKKKVEYMKLEGTPSKAKKIKTTKDFRVIEMVEAYPDLRGRRVILWIDDLHETNNKKVLDQAEAFGVTPVRLESTEEALDFLEHNKCILNRPLTRFRIITDMSRKEGKPLELKINAGLDLIKEIRKRYDYKEQIYVYTSVKRCEENKKKFIKEKMSDVYVTANEAECLRFGSFADVREKEEEIVKKEALKKKEAEEKKQKEK